LSEVAYEGPLRQVLIVGDFASINGGQAKVAIDAALLLADAGFEVTFFAASGPVCRELEHPGIRVRCLEQHTLLDNPSRVNAMLSGLWNRAALSALREEIARLDPRSGVVHCHGWAKALSPSVGRALAQSRVPVLYTMHEYFLACPNGGFFDYQRREICHRRAMSADCLSTNCDARHAAHKAWRVARSAVARGPGRLPDGLRHVAYISQTQLGVMRPYLPERAQLHHLPNPVALGGAPVKAEGNENFVFVGRLAPETGSVRFARAAARAGVQAVFVGDGPEAEAIAKANPEARITGWVSPQDVQQELAMARALVFPSLWYEAQPLVTIEAQLRNIPVVCGRWSAASEHVRDGFDGVIYDDPGEAALTEALGRVAEIGPFDASALRAETSPERHLSRLLAIFDKMLAEARG
jgi:glycosyltransferase involved in cell wall biosynthesis